MLLWEGYISEHVGLGLVHQRGKLGQFGPHLVGDGAPLLTGRFGGLLGESGADKGRNDPPAAFAGVGQE